MKVKVISKKDNSVTFIVDEASPALVNSIRRAASFRVPVLAIEDVFYTKNSSAVYDEQLAHRLGLLPLKTPKGYSLRSECVCKNKGCSRCQVKLSLKVKGPCTVYAKDFKSDDKKAEPVYPNTQVAILLDGQEIDLTAVAVLGQGSEHTKWSPCHAFYRGYPSIKIKDAKGATLGIKHCPRNVFDGAKVKNAENCDMCLSCVDRSEGAIEVSEVEGKYIFTLESWGQLAPEEILSQSADIVKNQLTELKVQ